MPVKTTNNQSSRPPNSKGRVLTVNGGSSSIKFAAFKPGDPPLRVMGGAAKRIGHTDAVLQVTGVNGTPERRPFKATEPSHAGTELLDWLENDGGLTGVSSVGHRIVHGGPNSFDPQSVTPELIADLKRAVPLDPNHLPAEIALIEALTQRLPGIPQVACFDTTFHRDFPPCARLLPIPRRYAAAGIRRYGFHGLSFAYLMGEIARRHGAQLACGRIVLAHLGSGASLAAVRGGQCVETTMGLTPAGGLVMSTRSGDIDPGVLIYLARAEGMTADQLDDLINRKSGLFGVSETCSDMQDLLARQADDPRAAEAVELFCYQARKFAAFTT